MEVIAKLKDFRQAAYNHLCRAKDATFELTDAVLLTRNAYCLAVQGVTIGSKEWHSLIFIHLSLQKIASY